MGDLLLLTIWLLCTGQFDPNGIDPRLTPDPDEICHQTWMKDPSFQRFLVTGNYLLLSDDLKADIKKHIRDHLIDLDYLKHEDDLIDLPKIILVNEVEGRQHK